jgi:hypothetical protein
MRKKFTFVKSFELCASVRNELTLFKDEVFNRNNDVSLLGEIPRHKA